MLALRWGSSDDHYDKTLIMRLAIIFSDGVHNVLFLASAVIALFTIASFGEQAWQQFDFRITAVEIVCEKPLNNRCFDQYSIKDARGKESIWSPHGFKFRENELVIGNFLRKNRFQFGYWVNERYVNWNFMWLHLSAFGFSLLLFGCWRLITKRMLPA